jgi:murein DD-endopeptidase MepM/ murein hydrolase activator NlpD
MQVQKPLMLAQKVWSSLPKKPVAATLLLFALPTFGVVTAFGIAPDTSLDRIERRDVVEMLSLPDFSPAPAASEHFHYQDKVQRGDTVAAILARLNVRDSVAFDFLRRAPEARNLFQLRPGRTVQVCTSGDGDLIVLRYFFSAEKFLEVTRSGDQFHAEEKTYVSAPQLVFKSATIRSSLFAATDYAGIPDAIAMQIARIFSTDIDFHVDLRKGDRFSVVYEMHYEDGELVRPGRVLSAEFVNDGRSFDAFLFADEEGSESYYSHNGENRAKSFLRSPLEFSRVSSGFGSRFHPVFKNWRAHTGVDFAAPKGTRIWAAADGQVQSAGVKGGYGNYIEIRHSGGIVTLYAHLSGLAPGIKRGARIRQGQVIGFVGATGWATGPHLHYEFKIAGIHHNPMRVALPKATPLLERLKPAFQLAASQGGNQLELLRTGNFGRFE